MHDKILEVLENVGKPVTPAQVASKLDIPQQTALRYLSNLMTNGRVKVATLEHVLREGK